MPLDRSEGRRIDPLGQTHRQRIALRGPRLEEEGGQDRGGCQREQERPGQGEDDRQRHRPEHLPFDPLQGQDRQMDHRDDRHAEDDRLADFQRRVADDVEGLLLRVGVRQVADAVLDDDDGAIDDQAEVDRPQAHQAASDAEVEHQVAGEEHRQRDRQRHDQSRSQIAQKHEQDCDDQDAPLRQVTGPPCRSSSRSSRCGHSTCR